LRTAVRCVMVLTLGTLGSSEFAVGLAIGSVSLFADSIDFLEDASVNFLTPGLATLGTAWEKFNLRQRRRVGPTPAPTPDFSQGIGASGL
jgi:hypothetical protein